MNKRKWLIVTIAVLVLLFIGGGSVYWWFNGNTRPWGFQGGLQSVHGETGEATFGRIVFVSPPTVELFGETDSSETLKVTVIVETTTKGFKWKNVGDSADSDGKLDFHARGRISKEQAEKLGLRWSPFSSWKLW